MQVPETKITPNYSEARCHFLLGNKTPDTCQQQTQNCNKEIKQKKRAWGPNLWAVLKHELVVTYRICWRDARRPFFLKNMWLLERKWPCKDNLLESLEAHVWTGHSDFVPQVDMNHNLLSGPKYIQLFRILHDWACKIFIQLTNIDIKWCKSSVDLLIWTPSSSYVCKTIYRAGLCLLDVFVGCFTQPSILRTSSRCSARFVVTSCQKVTQNIPSS